MPLINGSFVVQPGVVVNVNTNALASTNTSAPNTLALIGPSVAGAPQTSVLITSPQQATSEYLSGDLLNAALLAFDPSSETGGVSQLYMLRVNSALSSGAKIMDSTNPLFATATITVAGTAATGQTYTLTSGTGTATYTSINGDTNSTIASALAIQINEQAAFQSVFTGFTATVNAAVITLTANYAGVDGNSIGIQTTATGTGTLTTSGATLTGGTGNTLITLTADDAGVYTNQIYYQVKAGSINGLKFTAGLASSSTITGGSVTQDNIYQPVISLQYTGTGSAATVTVNDTTLTTSITGNSGQNLNLSFSHYTTVQQLVSYINATGVYTATVAISNAATLSTTALFDPLTNANIKTNALTLTANLTALNTVINSGNIPYFTGVRKTNPVSGSPAINTNIVYFVGGSDGTTSTQDWTNTINTLQTQDVDIICPVTDNATIHAAVSAHCTYMSGPTINKNRVFIVGGALGEYDAANPVPTQTIIDRAVTLNTSLGVLVSPGVKVADSQGNVSVMSSVFQAAMFAGMLAAVNPGTPLTHKYYSNVSGLEVNFTPSDIEALLQAGVAPAQYVKNKGYRIVQSITTYQGPANLAYDEISVVVAINSISEAVDEALDEQLVGTALTPQTLNQAISITETVLIQQQNSGVIVGTTSSPGFQNITATTTGNGVINISFQCSPTVPNNFIGVTIYAVPYSSSASTSSTTSVSS